MRSFCDCVRPTCQPRLRRLTRIHITLAIWKPTLTTKEPLLTTRFGYPGATARHAAFRLAGGGRDDTEECCHLAAHVQIGVARTGGLTMRGAGSQAWVTRCLSVADVPRQGRDSEGGSRRSAALFCTAERKSMDFCPRVSDQGANAIRCCPVRAPCSSWSPPGWVCPTPLEERGTAAFLSEMPYRVSCTVRRIGWYSLL